MNIIENPVATLNSDELFAAALRDSEDEVVTAMTEFITKKCRKNGVNEAAKVTASIKVLELLADNSTPPGLMTKLEPLRQLSIGSLRDVVTRGKVAAAKANAGAFILKAIRNSAPAVWPPDTNDPKWKQRMARALAKCEVAA